jgi:hypothetical protein
MQHVHNIEPLRGQRQSLAPLRITVVQPSVWERITAKMDQALSQEQSPKPSSGQSRFFWLPGFL